MSSINSPIGHPSGWEECAAWAATIYLSATDGPAWLWAKAEFSEAGWYTPVAGCSHDWRLSSEDVA